MIEEERKQAEIAIEQRKQLELNREITQEISEKALKEINKMRKAAKLSQENQ